MTRFAPLRLLALLLLVLAAGCASGAARNLEGLHLASRDYHDALQFKDFQVIARYLEPARRNDFLSRAYGMEKKLSVLEFVPIATQVDEEGESALMITRLSWYELPSTVVRTENVLLHWKLVEGGGGAWMLRSIEGGPLPVEPVEEDAPARPGI